MITIDEILTNGKKEYFNYRRKTQEASSEKLWVRWEPILKDYLNGLTIREVSKKYKVDRSAVYEKLRKAHLPVITRDIEIAANKFVPNRDNNRMRELEKCSCFICRWIKSCLILKEKKTVL